MDGNMAASLMAYLFSEVASIYPITPSSPMASNVDLLSSEGKKNLFDDNVKVLEMQSEAGAAGAMHGALINGSLATTFTASQGLLLMIPNMYKIAGEGLPGVIHVASRTVATHALSIFGDHSDVYAVRDTGFVMLASSGVEQAYHLSAVAHLAAIDGSLPVLHFFDGFRTSHELNTVEMLDDKELLSLVPHDKLKEFKERSLKPMDKKQYGLNEGENIYFESVIARSDLYDKMPDIINKYMQSINKIAKTDYQPFNYYGNPNAKNIIVAMGSICETIKYVVDRENKNGNSIGMIEVHLYRPFSMEYFLKVLPKSVTNIAVLDRTMDLGGVGNPLYLDVLGVVDTKKINVVGGSFGLSSKNTTPKDIMKVYEMLNNKLKNRFTIGINDDLNNTNLDDINYEYNLDSTEILIYGFGSDGMVSASKDIMHIIGEEKYVQSYSEYDSKKSGGVTVSHIRYSDNKINAPYYVEHASLVVVTKDEYFKEFNLLDKINKNGILLVNTSSEQELFSKMSSHDVDNVIKKNIRVLIIDADKIALRHNIKGKISKIMEIVILNLLGYANLKDKVIEGIKNKFKTKGEDIVNNNIMALEDALKSVTKCIIKETNKEEIKPTMDLVYKMNHRLDNISVKDTLEYRNGCFPGGLTSNEKRHIANFVSKWNKENCIECGMCSMVCPHAAIRPFLIKDNEEENKYHFIISVSEEDCTGCGLCVNICPGKMGNKALSLGKYDNSKSKDSKELFEHYENPMIYPKFTIKGSQLIKPKFEFSGACAGCGEASYIKLLTQLYGDQIMIVNATGCSSIYGGSAPSTPYSLPWVNSLFEDNAEAAYGVTLSLKNKREQIKNIMKKTLGTVSLDVKKLYNTYLENSDSYEKSLEIKNNLNNETIPEELKELLPYMPRTSVWAIGGDGWAYDIGFGGIDHVLSSGENINILVLDTEVYSNTGGQMSKSSHHGAVCEFANTGKKTYKKDLFKIAMCYPNVYAATISLGANMMQAIKVFKEAQEHNGPSIIIAYSPCIEHGIKGGMSCANEEQKLAVASGYFILMRYDGSTNKLIIDSHKPDFSLYDKFLDNEVRYNSLKIKNSKEASILLEENKKASIERYEYYKKISNNS